MRQFVVTLVIALAACMLVAACALFAAHQYQALQNEAAEAARARDAARSQLIAYEAARARADRLTTELAEAREAARQKTEELQDALQRETAGRECLRGNALRLLNNAPGLRVSAPTGGAVAADAARVATDTDLARWATRAGEQYAECQRRLGALIEWHRAEGDASRAAWPPKGARDPLGGQRVTDPQSGAGANVGALQ